MIRAFFFFFFFGLMVIGCSFIILYINFISRRIECYYSIIGLIIMVLSISIKGDKKNEFYLWYSA